MRVKPQNAEAQPQDPQNTLLSVSRQKIFSHFSIQHNFTGHVMLQCQIVVCRETTSRHGSEKRESYRTARRGSWDLALTLLAVHAVLYCVDLRVRTVFGIRLRSERSISCGCDMQFKSRIRDSRNTCARTHTPSARVTRKPQKLEGSHEPSQAHSCPSAVSPTSRLGPVK